MKEFLTHPVFNIISEIISEKDQQAFVIGGFVRDILLKRPSKDIDIVCLGSGIELAEKTAKKISPKIVVSVFKNFGTAMFKTDDIEFEFVGARRESYNRNSRKPIVEDGSLEDDQNRRDFTINALALSLHKSTFGQLIDPFNGIEDLKNKIIRTPLDPDITFSDDPLRMIRAIRFSSQLGFTIESKSYQAIKENTKRIEIVSFERIVDELHKIILSPKPSVGLKLLEETGMLAIIFPELQALKGYEVKEGKAHKDNFYHTLQVVDNLASKSNNLWLRWAALLHDIAKPITKKYVEGFGWTFHGHEFIGSKMVFTIFKNMKMPLNEKLKYVQKLVLLHLRPIILAEEEVTDSAVRRLLFDAGDDIDDLMMLCEADITSKNDIKVKQYMHNFAKVREKLVEVEEKDALRNWQPPISGDQIIEIFGLEPGRIVGDLKTRIKNAVLDGEINNNYEEAYNFLVKIAAEMNLSPKLKY